MTFDEGRKACGRVEHSSDPESRRLPGLALTGGRPGMPGERRSAGPGGVLSCRASAPPIALT